MVVYKLGLFGLNVDIITNLEFLRCVAQTHNRPFVTHLFKAHEELTLPL